MKFESHKETAQNKSGLLLNIVYILISKLNITIQPFPRRRKMRNRFYIPRSVSARDDMPLWDLESLENESLRSAVPGPVFVSHCDLLAQDNNLGYKKELDYIASSSSAATSVNSLASTGEPNTSPNIMRFFETDFVYFYL